MKTIILILALSLLSSPAAAGPIEDAVKATDRGDVIFRFDTRDGVRGNGRTISTGDTFRGWYRDHERLVEGPAIVILAVRDGVVFELETRVGGRERRLRDVDTDVGEVSPRQAVDYLLALVETARRDEVAQDAIFPATLARDITVWPELLTLARDRDLDNDVREQAIFWLGQMATEAVVEDLGDIVDDEDDEVEVRKSAIFALSQHESDLAVPRLIRVALENRHPELKESALFWLAQHDDPRVLDLFEDILSSH